MADIFIGLTLGIIINLIIGGICYLFFIDIKNSEIHSRKHNKSRR